jgi:hypothetical protein
MAQDIVGSLFGMTQQPDYSTQDYRTAIAMAEMNSPQQFGRFLGGMIGAPVGRAVAQGVGGLLGVQDPRLQQASIIREAQQQGFDVTTPEGLQQLAQFFVQRGQPGLASQVATQAQTMSRSAAEEQYKLAQAEKASREDVGETVNRDLYAIALRDAGNDPLRAAQLYNERRQLEKRSVAAAGAAQYGQEKIGNLSGAQGIVEKYTKQPFERLQAIDEAKGFLGMASTGNTAAVPQLRRALVRLGGPDSQLAAREIASIAGNAGIVGNVANAVNNFFTGTPTKEEIKLIGKVIAGAEGVIANQYTQGRQQAETVLGAAKLDPQTREALLPPVFKKAEPKKATSTGGWKILEVK